MKLVIPLSLLLVVLILAACDSNTSPTSGTPAIATSTSTSARAQATITISAATGTKTAVLTATPAAPPPIGGIITPTASITATLLQGFPSGVTALAWSPDGTLLATATGGIGDAEHITGTDAIWVWNTDGTAAGKWAGHTSSVTRLAWSPDGAILASADISGTVIFWGANGERQKALRIGAGAVFGLDWSPDGQKLAIGSVQDPTHNAAQIWTRDGTLKKTMHTKYSGGKFYNLKWSPDGKYLAGGATDYDLWDAAGNVITTTTSCPHCTPSWGLAWSPDSKLWATGDESGYVALHDIAGKKTVAFNTQSGADVIAWSPDGTKLVVSSEVWRPDGTQIGTLPVLGTYATALAWSPNGQMIAAGGRNVVAVFTPDRLQLYRFAEDSPASEPYPVNQLAWSPDGKTLVAGYSDNVARMWRIGK